MTRNPDEQSDSDGHAGPAAELGDAYEVTPVTVSTDENEHPATGAVVDLKPPQHEDRLREWVLIGLFLTLLSALITILLGLSWHWFGDDLAKTIIQTVISPVIAASTTIIGYLFAERRK